MAMRTTLPVIGKVYLAGHVFEIEIGKPKRSLVGVCEKAAEHRRTPKRGRKFHVQSAIAFWSAALLRRFSMLAVPS